MFTLRWTPAAQAEYEELRRRVSAAQSARGRKTSTKPSRAEGIFKQVHKTLALLSENPRHPALKTHEYHSIDNPFDASQGDCRVFRGEKGLPKPTRSTRREKRDCPPRPASEGIMSLDASQKVFDSHTQHKTSEAYRVFWCYGPNKKDIVIIAIAPHP